MQEGGRSIVWKSVIEVLTKYSRRGKIGTKERPKPDTGLLAALSDRDVADWYADMGVKDKGFHALPQALLEDIAAEVAQAIETKLDALESPAKPSSSKRPGWLKVLKGGTDGREDGGAAPHPASDGAAEELPRGGSGEAPREEPGGDGDGDEGARPRRLPTGPHRRGEIAAAPALQAQPFRPAAIRCEQLPRVGRLIAAKKGTEIC